MNLTELVRALKKAGARLSVVDDALRVEAPKGALDRTLQDAIRHHKAELIGLLKTVEPSQNGSPIPSRGRTSAPLSLAQERVWLFQALEEDSTAYNLTPVVRLTGRLDVGRLEEAIGRVVLRHAPLHAVVVEGREPIYELRTEPSVPFRYIDLSDLGGSELDSAFRQVVDGQQGAAFEIARDLPLRVTLVRRSSETHDLVVTFHHLSVDGLSLQIFFRDLLEFYERRDPEALPVSYVDFSEWQRDRWGDPVAVESALGFWRDHLGEAPQILELPTDRPRGARSSYGGRLVQTVLDAETSARLTELAREEGASLFMALLAAFAASLHRHSGQRDMVVGTPVSGRERPELQDLVGMFVNQLPLRVRVTPGGTFRELLAQSRATALAALSHQDVPFSLLVDDIATSRSAAVPPLFQTMLNVVPGADRNRVWKGREIEIALPPITELLALFDGQSKFDLTLYGIEDSSSIRLALVYNNDLFAAERTEALLGDVERILKVCAAQPDRTVDSVLWEDTAPPPFRIEDRVDLPDETVSARFEAAARRDPGRTALIHADGRTTSYGELLADVERIATLIAQASPDRSTPVGVLVGHEDGSPTAILGVLRSGHPYVPLDPQHPRDRLSFMIHDSGVGPLLASSSNLRLARDLVPDGQTVLSLGAAVPPTAPLPENPGPGDVAYLLYTSGSTGQSKAVIQIHRNVVRQADRYARLIGMVPEDRVALTASISFDACVMDLFGALLNGAALAPLDLRVADPSRLPEITSRLDLSVMHVTPTVFRTLARVSPDQTLPTIRVVDLGGEPVRPEDVTFFRRAFRSDAMLVNSYGPSEHTLALGFRIDPTVQMEAAEVPIGWPIGDVEVVLLDESGRSDPVRGEMLLRSAYGAIGYWNRPDLTEKAFLTDPADPAVRMYRTGDVVRRRHDGAYIFLHRADDQLKIRGHRVEPGEVESVLNAHPGVAEVAVHGPTTADGLRTLVACVVPASLESPPTSPELADWCRERLPSYMVPSAWTLMSALPRTPTGKIDRKSLPTGEASGQAGAGAGAPRNAEEEVLAGIWMDVLDLPSVGVFDDFFELGGHSLSATQVVARVRDLLAVEISLRDFFDHPTIAEIARHVKQRDGGAVSLPPIERIEGSRGPLSFSQERMWFLQELSPEDSAYNMAAAVLLEGDLDVDRLARAFHAVAERQESLRTRIVSIRGRAVQEILPEPNHLFRVVDLSHLPELDRLEAAKRAAADVLNPPYDLSEGPLVRVLVGKLGAGEHLVAFGMHHAVSDLWSFGVMGRELAAAYRGEAFPPAEVGYRDYSVWQREWLSGGPLEAQLGYWRDRLVDIKPIELPTSFPRPLFYSFAGDNLQVEIPAGMRRAVQELATTSRATPFMAFLTGFNILLHAYSRQVDLAVGVPIANRTLSATEGLVGTFVNTLIHRNDLSGDPTFRELLDRVRNSALDAYAHQDVPFEVLVKELQPERDTSRSPLFQVLFNVANVRTDGGDLEGIKRTVVPLPRSTAQFDLTVNVALNALQSEVFLSYNTSLFTRETAQRFLDHYLEILERAVANPDASLSELAGVSRSDRALLLEDWNRTEREYPRGRGLPELLVDTAQRLPDRVAVTSPTGSWTYAELREQAQRVTAALVDLGVQPGDRVAILMERSREMLAALLGILGAGATYIPVDPAYPEARVRYMLESSGAALMVSHRGLDRRLEHGARVLDLENWALPDPVPFRATHPEQAAYVIYTSGSTGQPKGVEVPHGAMVNFLFAMAEEPGLAEQDVLLAVTTISFDISVLELYLPLLVGARVVIAGEAEITDGRRLAERLEAEGVTLMQATPATWKLLITAGWKGKPDLRVLCGGEPLPASLAANLLELASEVWNMYGPTETTVWSTRQRILDAEPILIGRPIANTTVYVLDEQRSPVPIGVPGELWIGGAGVANGYLGRPDLTAERFAESPFREGERIYRTGDLVRYRADGCLEHLGRLDHQVKVRGFRIELGEVEAVLRSNPGVRDATVVARDERLIAYLIHELDAPTVGELRSWVSDRLPPYMMPSFFVSLEAFPLTPNGKVDRKRLPDPGAPAAEAATFRPPTLPQQRVIAEVWSELLGMERIGLNENFFELGGHSLMAMEVVALVEERTGHRLEPRSLFFKTLEQLAESLPASMATR